MPKRLSSKLKVILLHYKRMGFANATSYIIQRIYKGQTLLSARLKNTDLQIKLRNNPYDTQVFTQIFLRDELNVHLPESPRVIIDGGANIGLATLYLKTKYPGATIIAIEPERSNFDLLVENTKAYQNIICLNYGIWNTHCRLQIIDTGQGTASFITRELADGNGGDNAIEAITIPDVMKQFQFKKLDLVKLDIEGSEKELFKDNYEEWLSKTSCVIVEIHRHLQPDCEATVFHAFEKDFAYSTLGEYSVFSRKSRA